jgi:hypothetical protein
MTDEDFEGMTAARLFQLADMMAGYGYKNLAGVLEEQAIDMVIDEHELTK